MKTAVLAGTHSGCGKTTAMLTLLQYLREKKQAVATFKAGPDFLDPLWHQAITGKPSYNLDTRMMGAEACKLQLRQARNADIALIEGVMGLFDGASGVGQAGSSVDLARVLGCPVILVVDAGGMSGSIAPLVSGFCRFAEQRGVSIAGIVANRVGSEHHAGLLKTALNDYDLPPLIAWMARSQERLGERHLGLKRPEEGVVPDFLPFFHADEPLFEQAFSEMAAVAPIPVQSEPRLKGKTVAVARDEACCFIYPANLDWLAAQGAAIRFFSPVAGDSVPEQADAVWLPGGYPELYVQPLSESASWASLRSFIEAGKPVLAECGGAMLLGRELVDAAGNRWPMAGVFPYASVMQPRLVALGYREDISGARGHEFHFSWREQDEGLQKCFDCASGDSGVRYKNVRASYVHWYFQSSDQITEWFL